MKVLVFVIRAAIATVGVSSMRKAQTGISAQVPALLYRAAAHRFLGDGMHNSSKGDDVLEMIGAKFNCRKKSLKV